MKTVQGNPGHASAAFTLDVYGHVSEHMKADSANRMQKYIEQHNVNIYGSTLKKLPTPKYVVFYKVS